MAHDYVTNLAFFLLEKTGSVCGCWKGHMKAAEQRELFGQFLGKGMLYINGEDETVVHTRKVCFGTDWEETANRTWRELQSVQ